MDVLPVRTFLIPPMLITGAGSVERAGDECRRIGGKKALIVTDAVLSKLGALEGVKKSLSQQGLDFVVYDKIASEPTDGYVREGLDICRDSGCDFLLAVGGGSAIDTAKAIAALLTNTGSIEEYKGLNKLTKKSAPLIAIPTTAGTGSEVTIFTIITDTTKNVKMLIGSPYLMPEVAIVDPLMTLSCPRGLTTAVGIDALTHAIEAYVSLKSQPMSDAFALSAIGLIAGNLRQVFANGNNVDAREKVMIGALEAGIAFSNASVALVHGMSRPIGAYFHVPHGASNAALLGVVTEFSLIGNPCRYAQIARAMGEDTAGLSDMDAAKRAADAVRRLIKDIMIPSLPALGVDGKKLEQLAGQMAEDAIASGSPGNNPRQATRDEIVELYRLAYAQ